MINWKKEIDGHTIEYSYGSTGSIDPWSLDFANQNNIALIVTSDIAYYFLVDNSEIFKDKRYTNSPDPYEMDTFDSISEYLSNYTEYNGNLQERIDKLKKYIKN